MNISFRGNNDLLQKNSPSQLRADSVGGTLRMALDRRTYYSPLSLQPYNNAKGVFFCKKRSYKLVTMDIRLGDKPRNIGVFLCEKWETTSRRKTNISVCKKLPCFLCVHEKNAGNYACKDNVLYPSNLWFYYYLQLLSRGCVRDRETPAVEAGRAIV